MMTPFECGAYCEACGDCMRCFVEDWCYESVDGNHYAAEGDE